MKKILTLFMCLALVGLYSCSDDDDEGGNGSAKEVKLNVNVKYNNVSENLPDEGSMVYFFENFDRNASDGKWEYVGEGKYKRDGKEQLFYTRGKADANGDVTLTVKANQYSTIVIEPKNGSSIKEEFIQLKDKDYNYEYIANAPK